MYLKDIQDVKQPYNTISRRIHLPGTIDTQIRLDRLRSAINQIVNNYARVTNN